MRSYFIICAFLVLVQIDTGHSVPWRNGSIMLNDKKKKNSGDFFSQMDEDGDGLIEPNEIRDFVVDIGGQAFNDDKEIDFGVRSILTHMDMNADALLSPKDLTLYWQKLGKLLTVEETAKWAEHAVQAPELGRIFLKNSVSGYDIPSLLTNKNEMEELGVPKRYQRILHRAISIKLMGLGEEPSPPEALEVSSVSCRSIFLKWKKPKLNGGVPVHKYVLERYNSPVSQIPFWEVVMHGPEEMYADNNLNYSTSYTYRVQAFNIVGHSEYRSITAQTFGSNCKEEIKALDSTKHQETAFRLTFIQQMWNMFKNVNNTVLVVAPIFSVFIVFLRLFLVKKALYNEKYREVDDSKNANCTRQMLQNCHQKVATSPFSSIYLVVFNYLLRFIKYMHPVDENSFSTESIVSKESHSANMLNCEATHAPNDQYIFGKIRFPGASLHQCAYCHSKFSWKRKKHHCRICSALFCQKHGHTAHKVDDCGIPGKCLCQECLILVRNEPQETDYLKKQIMNDIFKSKSLTKLILGNSSSSKKQLTAEIGSPSNKCSKAQNKLYVKQASCPIDGSEIISEVNEQVTRHNSLRDIHSPTRAEIRWKKTSIFMKAVSTLSRGAMKGKSKHIESNGICCKLPNEEVGISKESSSRKLSIQSRKFLEKFSLK